MASLHSSSGKKPTVVVGDRDGSTRYWAEMLSWEGRPGARVLDFSLRVEALDPKKVRLPARAREGSSEGRQAAPRA